MTPLLLSLVLAQQPVVAPTLPVAGDTTKGRPCVIAIDSLPRGRQVTAGGGAKKQRGRGVRGPFLRPPASPAPPRIFKFFGVHAVFTEHKVRPPHHHLGLA